MQHSLQSALSAPTSAVDAAYSAIRSSAAPRIEALMTREVVTATESDSLALAAELMSRGGYRHLPVVRGGQLVGLVSHCDVLRTLALLLRSALPNRDRRDRQRVAYGIAVGDVMVREVASVHPDTSAYLAAVILRGSARGCLPVVSGGCLVGIVTPSDFMGLVARALGCR